MFAADDGARRRSRPDISAPAELVEHELRHLGDMLLSALAILYLNPEYVSLCSKISKHAYNLADHQDIGFAEIQRYFNVYAFDDPFFYKTSSNGTVQHLSYYPI